MRGRAVSEFVPWFSLSREPSVFQQEDQEQSSISCLVVSVAHVNERRVGWDRIFHAALLCFREGSDTLTGRFRVCLVSRDRVRTLSVHSTLWPGLAAHGRALRSFPRRRGRITSSPAQQAKVAGRACLKARTQAFLFDLHLRVHSIFVFRMWLRLFVNVL